MQIGNADALAGILVGNSVKVIGSALAQCVGAALLARVVFAEIEGRALPLGAALRGVLARLHVVIGLAFLTALASYLGMCCLVLPYFLVSWKLAVAPIACVIEERGLGASLRRSFALTRRGWWRWVFLTLSSYLIGLPFAGVAALGDQD